MLTARAELAGQLKAKKLPTADKISETVLNFFEDLALAHKKGYIEKKLAGDTFGFYLCRWWEAVKPYVYEERRRHQEDVTLFARFEKLAVSERLPNEIIDDKELQLFLEDESKLISS